MSLLRCRVLASQSADTVEGINPGAPDTFSFEFDAPDGWEEMVGRGVLHMADFSFDAGEETRSVPKFAARNIPTSVNS